LAIYLRCEASHGFGLFPDHLQLFVLGRLFLGLLHKVSQRLALHHIIVAKYLIEVFFQFLSSLLNVLRVLVCYPEQFLLRKLWSFLSQKSTSFLSYSQAAPHARSATHYTAS
jgi:hypothetical protein